MADTPSVVTEKQVVAEPAKTEPVRKLDGSAVKTKTETKPKETTEPAKTEPAATPTDEEEVFYDPKDLPPELKAIHKKMQASLTKRTQGIADIRKKAAMVDQFNSDLLGNMQRLAAQHGYQLLKQGEQSAQPKDWQPQTWQEVQEKIAKEAKEQAKKELLGELSPFLNEIKRTKQSQIEQILDSEAPEWREYEDEFAVVLTQHPTLANDPAKLARLAIPKEVQESKAMQLALKRMEDKAKASQVSSGSTTSKFTNGTKPNRKLSFNEAVEFSKALLDKQGIRPGG